MLKRSIWLASAIIILVCTAAGVVRALGGVGSPWQNTSNPTLTKSIDLSANALPSSSNFDCTEITVRTYLATSTHPDCVVRVPSGQVGQNGIIFDGSSESIPVVPESPLFGLQPIPNNGTLMTYATAPIVGNYLLFYTSIRDKISDLPQFVNGHWQYTVIKGPDYRLKDTANKLLAANINAMTFSANGSWMVVDLPWQGFVRVNLSTFEIKPFASSMQQNGDYSDHRAQIAISNDGLNIVVKPNGFDQLKVYDLSSCDSISLPVDPGTDRCSARDYYGYISSQLTGLRAIYQPRFVNGVQLSFAAVYDYSPGNYKVAKYTLTAPGENPTGMSYLGMGDSFASGEGAFDYVAGTDTTNDTCHLSSKNYAYLLSSHQFSDGRSVACSGAVSDDIIDDSNDYTGQVHTKVKKILRDNALSVLNNFTPGYLAQTEFIDQYRPEAITLSVGGNDIGFADILTSCVSPVSPQESCYPNYEDRLELANKINGIFDRLVATYQTVQKPGKRLYVVGYPQITFPGGNCASNVHMDDHELQLAADLIEYINLVINRAADKAGARYVDVSNAFVGHRLCETKSSDIAVNGFTAGTDSGAGALKFVGNESYHPNALGHALFEKTIRAQTNDLRQSMPLPNPNAQAPALPVALSSQSLPKTSRKINTVVTDDSIAPNLLTRTQNVNVVADGARTALKALSVYRIVMHSDEVSLGTATTDAQGNLAATLQLPSSLPAGFHTLHIYGPNMLGQPLDITKTVYVAASATDFDGNGTLDTMEPCVFVPASGLDVDMDGIDDACDGYIGDPPLPKFTTTHLSGSVTMTGNSITITKSTP